MIFSTPAPYSENRLSEMLARNAQWAGQITAQDPDYFKRLSAGQSPAFTVISCCDSRADPNTLLQSNLGELFVYKNVANQAGLNDLSLQTAIQFSIDSLKVKHILVFGHHNCGGVRIALGCMRAVHLAIGWKVCVSWPTIISCSTRPRLSKPTGMSTNCVSSM